MSDQIGGAISSITDMSQRAQTQAEETEAATAETESLVANLQDQVDAVSDELQRRFEDLSARLLSEVDSTSRQLEAAEWTGKSRDTLVAFDADLRATAERFMSSSNAGMADFRSSLMSYITEFFGVIQGEYRTAMQEIQAKYGDASRAAQTYAQNLQEMDNTTITLQ
jgi:hypothetical protein